MEDKKKNEEAINNLFDQVSVSKYQKIFTDRLEQDKKNFKRLMHTTVLFIRIFINIFIKICLTV